MDIFSISAFGGQRDYNNRREGFMSRDRPAENDRFDFRVNEE